MFIRPHDNGISKCDSNILCIIISTKCSCNSFNANNCISKNLTDVSYDHFIDYIIIIDTYRFILNNNIRHISLLYLLKYHSTFTSIASINVGLFFQIVTKIVIFNVVRIYSNLIIKRFN